MTGTRRVIFPAVRGNMPSRKASDLRHQDAATLTAAVGLGLAEAVRVTAGWSRRRLLDTALTLAYLNRRDQP